MFEYVDVSVRHNDSSFSKGFNGDQRISLSADLANEQARATLSHLGLQESEQVGVHVFFLGRAQAMRGALVNFQGRACKGWPWQ
jgi:hypothetical protein